MNLRMLALMLYDTFLPLSRPFDSTDDTKHPFDTIHLHSLS